MEKIRMKAEELRELAHQVKDVAQLTIRKVKALHDETVKTCDELTAKAYKMLDELDKTLENIETDKEQKGNGNAKRD